MKNHVSTFIILFLFFVSNVFANQDSLISEMNWRGIGPDRGGVSKGVPPCLKIRVPVGSIAGTRSEEQPFWKQTNNRRIPKTENVSLRRRWVFFDCNLMTNQSVTNLSAANRNARVPRWYKLAKRTTPNGNMMRFSHVKWWQKTSTPYRLRQIAGY